MALNQHPSSATAVSGSDKGELCTQKENAAIEEKEPKFVMPEITVGKSPRLNYL